MKILSYMEQVALFSAMNFSIDVYHSSNSTVIATGQTGLWCPSDGSIIGLVDRGDFTKTDGLPQPVYYSSYAGNLGTWVFNVFSGPSQPQLSQSNGVLYTIGGGSPGNASIAPTRLSGITDGTSNTMAYSEHAHGLFSKVAYPGGYGVDFCCWNWWVSGNDGDTLYATLYPINPQRRVGSGYANTTAGTGDDVVLSASSFHPGGANFAFCDGSVRFLKDSIDTWQMTPAGDGTLIPVGFTENSSGVYTATGTGADRRLPGSFHASRRRGDQQRRVLRLAASGILSCDSISSAPRHATPRLVVAARLDWICECTNLGDMEGRLSCSIEESSDRVQRLLTPSGRLPGFAGCA